MFLAGVAEFAYDVGSLITEFQFVLNAISLAYKGLISPNFLVSSEIMDIIIVARFNFSFDLIHPLKDLDYCYSLTSVRVMNEKMNNDLQLEPNVNLL